METSSVIYTENGVSRSPGSSTRCPVCESRTTSSSVTMSFPVTISCGTVEKAYVKFVSCPNCWNATNTMMFKMMNLMGSLMKMMKSYLWLELLFKLMLNLKNLSRLCKMILNCMNYSLWLMQ